MAADPVELSRAATLLATLAVASRLRLLATVLELWARGADRTLASVAAASGRSQRDLAKDLGHLHDCGLVGVRDGVVTPHLEPLRTAAAAVDDALPVTALLAHDPALARLFSHGRLVTEPEDPALWARIADLAVRLLPEDEELPEAEVNRLLRQIHPDHATLRRLLVDRGLLTRRDGSVYRRPSG